MDHLCRLRQRCIFPPLGHYANDMTYVYLSSGPCINISTHAGGSKSHAFVYIASFEQKKLCQGYFRCWIQPSDSSRLLSPYLFICQCSTFRKMSNVIYQAEDFTLQDHDKHFRYGIEFQMVRVIRPVQFFRHTLRPRTCLKSSGLVRTNSQQVQLLSPPPKLKI